MDQNHGDEESYDPKRQSFISNHRPLAMNNIKGLEVPEFGEKKLRSRNVSFKGLRN